MGCARLGQGMPCPDARPNQALPQRADEPEPRIPNPAPPISIPPPKIRYLHIAMIFASNLFLLYFLPVFLVVYLVTPQKLRNLVALVGSLLF